MQLISCTHCHKTWTHREEENPSQQNDAPRISIRKAHDTPCFHHYTVDVSLYSMKSVFEAVPYIPTLTDSVDVEFVAMLIRHEANDKNFIQFYHDLMYDLVGEDFVNTPCDGEGSYIRETISYQGQEVEHLAYFEPEDEFYVFTLSELRVLSYLYKKDPVAMREKIAAWYKDHNSMVDFHRGLEEFEATHGQDFQ